MQMVLIESSYKIIVFSRFTLPVRDWGGRATGKLSHKSVFNLPKMKKITIYKIYNQVLGPNKQN